jgi:large subunit ribosomal protein L29
MKTTEVRDLSIADLKERIDAEKANMVKMKLNHATSPVENASEIRKARRAIARMMTILGQKQNAK